MLTECRSVINFLALLILKLQGINQTVEVAYAVCIATENKMRIGEQTLLQSYLQIGFFVLSCFMILLQQKRISCVTSTATSDGNYSNTAPATGWVRPNVVFGHIHLAKTAGTTLNGLMASRFERVCGHKGYSYDYHQYNERLKEGKSPWHYKSDRASGRVDLEVMDDIGYTNCDWISFETKMSNWKNRFSGEDKAEMEMHVPCRDPMEHFMSQCNYRGHIFDCGISDPGELAKEIHRCLKDEDRFQAKAINEYSTNVQFKCFDPIPVTRYIDYMGHILQEKQVVTEHVERETNKKRDKSKECIGKMTDPEKRNLLDALQQQWGLYEFCEACMGSEQELPLPAAMPISTG